MSLAIYIRIRTYRSWSRAVFITNKYYSCEKVFFFFLFVCEKWKKHFKSKKTFEKNFAS